MNNHFLINNINNMNNQNWMNMMNNNNFNNINNNMLNFNPNLMNNNMNQMPNQINPLINMNMMNINEQMTIFNLNQRIIELENIIKKKDMKIAKLKEKLNRRISFDDYIFFPNINESDDEDDDEDENKVFKNLELNIIYNPPEQPNNKFEFKEFCNLDERIKSIKRRLFEKISKKFKVKFRKLQFMFNYYPLKDNLLVSESGLTNGSNIMIINSGNIRGAGDNNENNKLTKDDSEDKICLTFQRVDGYRISIYAYRDIPIGIVLIYYFLRDDKFYELLDFINGSKNIAFLFNGLLLNIKDHRSIGEFFGIVENPKIIVNDTSNLIGG